MIHSIEKATIPRNGVGYTADAAATISLTLTRFGL